MKITSKSRFFQNVEFAIFSTTVVNEPISSVHVCARHLVLTEFRIVVPFACALVKI